MAEENKSALRFENSLSSLVSVMSAGYLQSNLTSFNPLAQNNNAALLSINWTNLTYMYKTHGLVQKMIDLPVMDAFRGGFEFTCPTLDHDDLTGFQHCIEDLEAIEKCKDMLKWGRLYGGGGIIINAWDLPAKQFAPSALLDGPTEFYDANRWELAAPMRFSPSYQFYGNTIDASRVITFGGKRAPHIIRQQLQGWGMSELERMVPDFLLFLRHRNVLYEMLQEAKVDVYRIEGLEQALMTADGTTKIAQRIQLSNMMKSYNNALIMPLKDEYEQKQLSFSGLGDINESIKGWLSMISGIPQSKLFGMGSSGFSSGEDDLENYNTSLVVGEVREPANPVLRKLFKICAIKCFGVGGEKHEITHKWAPLREMSSADEEGIKSSKHTRYAADLDRGIITPEEYGIICHKEKLIPIETAAQRGEVDKEDLAAFMDMGDEGGGGAGGGAKEEGAGKKGKSAWVHGPAGGMRKKTAYGWEYQKADRK